MPPNRDAGCAQASHLRRIGNWPAGEVVTRPMRTQRRLLPILAVLALLIVACGTSGAAPSAPPGTGLAITAAAGPTCPVETIPPDPACAPRPVAGATILVKDGQGKTVATAVTDANGTVLVALPAGDYAVEPQPAAGLMGTAAGQEATVVDGTMTPVLLAYDTGIR
jgi:hypothetical protein